MRYPQNFLSGGFLSVTFLPFTHTIYTLITHRNYKENIQREKPQIGFLQHTHPSFRKREGYSFLVRNHSSLFSFPLPLSYLEMRFVPKHNSHRFRVYRVFWSLGSLGDLPKEDGEAWQMQSIVLHDLEGQRRQGFVKSVGSKSLEGSSTWGRLGLKGLLLFVHFNLFSNGSIYHLEGG